MMGPQAPADKIRALISAGEAYLNIRIPKIITAKAKANFLSDSLFDGLLFVSIFPYLPDNEDNDR